MGASRRRGRRWRSPEARAFTPALSDTKAAYAAWGATEATQVAFVSDSAGLHAREHSPWGHQR